MTISLVVAFDLISIGGEGEGGSVFVSTFSASFIDGRSPEDTTTFSLLSFAVSLTRSSE